MRKKDIINVLLMTVFVLGTFNVSISNILGGYYFVGLLTIIGLGACFYITYIKKYILNMNQNVNRLLAIAICSLNFLFFIVNDLLSIKVYTKSNFNFLTILVVFSQILSIGSILYNTLYFTIDFKKKNKFYCKDDFENNNFNQIKSDTSNVTEKVIKKEIKSISLNSNDVKAPYMEEEK